MGKAAITRTSAETAANLTQMKTTKKKGRPSFADLQKRKLEAQTPSPKFDISTTSRRSTRRRNSGGYNSMSSEFISDDYEEDDDERKEKKVKLVGRLPQSTSLHSQDSSCQNSGSASDSEPEEGEDHDASLKGGRINVVESRSNEPDIDQGKQDWKVTDTLLHGSSLEGGPPTKPLPDKKLLLFILDRLQKKDTHGVFAEPVDPDELPDYHEIIEHPMDFGTLRKKLDGRGYSNLEELEADVYLICSNAMEYNASDTVYHRQARSIQELAKRDFANLRHEGDNGEPKVVRRGRPPGKSVKKPIQSSPADCTEYKNAKKPIENSPDDRAGIHISSGATLASGEETATGSNAYNLRKGPAMYRVRYNDAFATNSGSRNGENYSDWLVDWNSEFPAKILRADMKYGKKHFSVDEYRRDTYKQHQPLASSNEQQHLSNTSGDRKQLIAVGLHMEQHGYARSIARFAANLGPVAWKVASMKIRPVLPDGTPFGPGWVGENDSPSQTSFFAFENRKPMNDFIDHHDSSKSVTPNPCLSSTFASRPPPDETPEAVKRLDFPNKLAEKDDLSWRTPGSAYQAQQKFVAQHGRNGFNGMFRHETSSQLGTSRTAPPMEEVSTSYQTPSMLLKSEISSPINSGSLFQAGLESTSRRDLFTQALNPLAERSATRSSHQVSSMQVQQRPLSIPPDLNVRVSASGSPSSMQIGSPQQQQPPQAPDLALQL